ncbi:unnamed protein product [Phytophthora fragariaefolia]|uniref:Unnamed protein product n=1 Tax=Phytophthora fragariaefolia TaxID=1490495 RepID=A0A9W7CVX6_9STRA|nr:unnamed protein product [Phytophthora fragariaefolia]
MGGMEAATALQLLRAKQNAYYIQAVQEALQAEEQRKQKLRKACKQEAKWLEKQFAGERSADRDRLLHIQEDHALLLNAKIAEWKATGGVVKLAPEAASDQQRTQRHKEKTHRATFSKDTLDRLAAPRAPTAKAEEAGAYRLMK